MSFSELNSPAVISSFVAIGSLALSFLRLFKENDANDKKVKRILNLAEAYAKLEKNSDARCNINTILDIETEKFKDMLTRKINYANLVALIFIAIVGGICSYGSLLLANNSSVILSALGWVLFSVIVFFTLGVSIAGLSSIYNNENNKKEKI